MVKKVNGFYLTRNIKHKFLVKVRPFSSAKTRCMYDHAKPTIRELNPEHIILHVGTNDLNTEKTASQVSKSILDLVNSLKNETNTIHASLIVPRNDHLNNKVNEVNSRLINMCQQQNIKIINHTDTIDPSKHLNESLFHLNRYGAIEFGNNFKKNLCNLDLCHVGHSEGLDHYEANITVSVRDTFHCDHNEVLSENGDEVSILCSAYYYNDNNINDDLVYINPVKVLNNIHQKHSNRLVIAQLNINSLRNKFAWLSTMIKGYDDLLLILETKIDSSFPTAQFHIDGYTIHRRDRDENGGGLLLYVREDVPSALLKWLLC